MKGKLIFYSPTLFIVEPVFLDLDRAIPTERGLLPGSGSLISVVSYSTEVEPTVIGKPEKIIMEEALRMIDLPREDVRSEEHTSELQSRGHLVCRLLLEKKNNKKRH